MSPADNNLDINDLIKQNMKLVYHIIHRKYPDFVNDDDIVQCGMIGLWKACKTFDADKASFGTYAGKCICNEIIMEFRRRKRCAGPTAVSLYDVVPGDPDNLRTFEDVIPDPEDYSAHVDTQQSLLKICKHLKPFEQQVLNLSVQCTTQSEVADILGVSRSYVSKVLNQIRAKISRQLN